MRTHCRFEKQNAGRAHSSCKRVEGLLQLEVRQLLTEVRDHGCERLPVAAVTTAASSTAAIATAEPHKALTQTGCVVAQTALAALGVLHRALERLVVQAVVAVKRPSEGELSGPIFHRHRRQVCKLRDELHADCVSGCRGAHLVSAFELDAHAP